MFGSSAIGIILLSAFMGLSSGQGTTPELKEIFMGRCYDFNLMRVGLPLPSVLADCPELWDLFQEAFANHSSCGLDERRYVPFLAAASQDIPVDVSLFWSDTEDLVHRLSQEGLEYVTLEDSLIGYLLDGLTWCGQEEDPGINYDKCPDRSECDGNSDMVFWDAASTWFASEAKGVVSVLLDGSYHDRPAYRSNSFFANVELPNLDPSKVSAINVMLVQRFGHPVVETCYNGTLKDLRHDVIAKGFRFHCQENPDNVLHLMCVDDPTNDECENVGTWSGRLRKRTWRTFTKGMKERKYRKKRRHH